jgi:predicted transcriptional regulator
MQQQVGDDPQERAEEVEADPAPAEDSAADGEVRAKVAATVDSLRFEIISRLYLQPATVREVAEDLGISVDRARRRIARMTEDGLVERLEGRPRRGVVEHVFMMKGSGLAIELGEGEDLSADDLDELVGSILRSIFAEAIASLRSGTYTARPEFATYRLPVRVDHQGWVECHEIHADARRRVAAAAEASIRRLAETGDEGIDASSVMLWFETGLRRASDRRR